MASSRTARSPGYNSMGFARTSAAPAGGAAGRPKSGPELATVHRDDRPPCHRCATHHTEHVLTHSPPILHSLYARHPGHCHLVTAPSTPPAHPTPPHPTPPHPTPPHPTPPPEYSPALPMGLVPGVKPLTTGPGHHPMGGVLTVSGVRTPHCQTPATGSPQPPSTGRLGSGNGHRPLVRMAGTASPSSPQRACTTHRALRRARTRATPVLCATAPLATAPARAPLPPSHPHLQPHPHRGSGRRR